MPKESARVLRELRSFMEGQVRRIQLRAYQALTVATPVDTGFARGAWVPSLGTPATEPTDAPRDRTAAETLAASNLSKHRGTAEQIARTYTLANGDVFISNNTPYIGRLNEGSSAQAPARFVEQAIARAVRGS